MFKETKFQQFHRSEPDQPQAKTFQPYFPLQINAHIFHDPELTDIEKTIISLAQSMRLQIMYAKSEAEQKEILARFTSSYFARATGRHRDHIRRVINRMQKNEAVKKYLTIFILPKIDFNKEQTFRFTFQDQLLDQLSVKFETGKKPAEESGLAWHDEVLIQNYLRDIKPLAGETAHSLINLIKCAPAELVKGLIYLKERLRRTEIKNPKGYLVNSFDLNGRFKYDIKPGKYLPADSDAKINSDFEYEVNKGHFLEYENALKREPDNKFRFFYRKAGDKIYLNKITEAGRQRNIKNHLKRADIDFKIVAANDYDGM